MKSRASWTEANPILIKSEVEYILDNLNFSYINRCGLEIHEQRIWRKDAYDHEKEAGSSSIRWRVEQVEQKQI